MLHVIEEWVWSLTCCNFPTYLQ